MTDWSDGFWKTLGFLVAKMISQDYWPVLSGIVLIVIVVTLVVFTYQQLSSISKGLTQVEIDKFENEFFRRQSEGIKDPLINIYDKGFVENWRSILFPPKIARHEPKDWSDFSH